MASALKSALPAHLKPSTLGNGDAGAEFARKHHGKTQSHMVSSAFILYVLCLADAQKVPIVNVRCSRPCGKLLEAGRHLDGPKMKIFKRISQVADLGKCHQL
jgi:hypothetical protein